MSVFSRYLPSINNAIAQQGQARANMAQSVGGGLGNILMALAQIQKRQQEEQLQSQANQEVNNTMFPQEQPNIGGAIGMMNPPTPAKQPTRDDLMKLFLSQNKYTAPTLQRTIQGLQMTAPQTIQRSPYEDTYKRDVFGNETLEQPAMQKPEKFSTGFGDFLKANSEKYANMPDGLSTAYQDFQNQELGKFGAKEEIKSKYRAQKDGKAISTYVSEDGYKMTLWRNPDGNIVEIPSNEKVRESAQSPTMQKEEQKLSTLQELSSTIRQQAKPEYLGGVTSGLAGQGFGGTLGGVREATGLISDEEAQFRANVASLKNQLLYLRSGAQINEQEFKRLEKELPDPSQPQNVFLNRLTTFDKQLNDILKSKSKGKPQTNNNDADPLGIR